MPGPGSAQRWAAAAGRWGCRLLALLLLLLLVPGPGGASEITFELPDNAKQCFYEDITQGTKCTLEFQVITGGHYDVDCRLEDPDGNVLYKEMKKQYDSFTFTASKNGTYKFCFSNEFSTFTHKTVYFDFQVGEDPPLFPSENRVSALTQMESACVSIHEALKSVIDYQTHFRLREAQGRSRAEDLNTRVAYWSVGEALILLVVSIGQVFLLKSFFSDKRTTTTRVGSELQSSWLGRRSPREETVGVAFSQGLMRCASLPRDVAAGLREGPQREQARGSGRTPAPGRGPPPGGPRAVGVGTRGAGPELRAGALLPAARGRWAWAREGRGRGARHSLREGAAREVSRGERKTREPGGWARAWARASAVQAGKRAPGRARRRGGGACGGREAGGPSPSSGGVRAAFCFARRFPFDQKTCFWGKTTSEQKADENYVISFRSAVNVTCPPLWIWEYKLCLGRGVIGTLSVVVYPECLCSAHCPGWSASAVIVYVLSAHSGFTSLKPRGLGAEFKKSSGLKYSLDTDKSQIHISWLDLPANPLRLLYSLPTQHLLVKLPEDEGFPFPKIQLAFPPENLKQVSRRKERSPFLTGRFMMGVGKSKIDPRPLSVSWGQSPGVEVRQSRPESDSKRPEDLSLRALPESGPTTLRPAGQCEAAMGLGETTPGEEEEEEEEEVFLKFVILHAEDDTDEALRVQSLLQNDFGIRPGIIFAEMPCGRQHLQNLDDAVNGSAWTILLLTENFLRDTWCKFQFYTSLMNSVNRRHKYNSVIPMRPLNKPLPRERTPFALRTINALEEDSRGFPTQVERIFQESVYKIQQSVWREARSSVQRHFVS
ncbi:uncharacterized protein LOC121495254 [Vulpes lagopus]|nr:uncharacterized protein LOC121495254 [Vulpes lagopus]